MSYRAKLILSFGIVLLLPLLLTFALARYWIQEGAVHEVKLRLDEAAQGLASDVDRTEKRLMNQVERMAAFAPLQDAVVAGDRRAAITILSDWMKVAEFDLIEAGDGAGRVFARGHKASVWGEDKSGQRIVAGALAMRTSADIERGASGIAVRAVAPLLRPQDSAPVGTLMIGISLDTEFVARYAQVTGVEIALFEGETPIAATRGMPAELAAVVTSAAPAAAPATVRFSDREYDIAVAKLMHSDGTRFGSVLAARNRGEVDRYLEGSMDALWVGLVVGGILTAAVILALVRTFAGPIEDLQVAMARIEFDGIETEIPVTRDDEFGELERRFNAMASKLGEARRRVERMQRERVRLAQKSLVERIAAEVAHEIRNPLNAMAAQIELMRPAVASDKDARRLEILSDEIRRLDRYVEDLVESTRPMSLSLRLISLHEKLDALIDLIEEPAAEKGIGIERRYDPLLSRVAMDPERMHQALLNVLLNAVESIYGTGSITVETADLGGRFRISIVDTGHGMTPEEREEIFDTYYTTKKDGTGLGLAVALRIVESHGGDIEVRSSRLEGTRVDVVLPKRENLA